MAGSEKLGYRVAQVLAKLVLLLHLIQEKIGEKLQNMLVSFVLELIGQLCKKINFCKKIRSDIC
jgi:hypothetical protein